MASFSLNEAWNEGVAFVRNNMREVAIWAAIGVLVPSVISLAMLGGIAEQQAMMEQMLSAGDPTAVLAALGGGAIFLSFLSQIVSTASYFGAWRMGLAREPVAAPQAGIYAVGAAITSLIVLAVLLFLVILLLFVPLGLLGAFGAMGSGGDASAGGMMAAFGFAMLALLVFFPLMLWLMARLSVMGPVMATAGSINPLYGIAQSWQLTKPAQWPILGYLVLLIIALFVVGMVVALISGAGMIVSGGLSGGEIGTGSLVFSTILGAIVGIPMAMAYIAVPAGIYRALRPDPVADVFQ